MKDILFKIVSQCCGSVVNPSDFSNSKVAFKCSKCGNLCKNKMIKIVNEEKK